MFHSLPTLHNCYTFVNVTGNMSLSDAKIVRNLHYLDEGGNTTAANVDQTLGTCLLKYCHSLPDCGAWVSEFNTSNPEDLSSWVEDPEKYSSNIRNPLVEMICNCVPARVSSDVGGIGVSQPFFRFHDALLNDIKIYASYWVQTGLALLGFIGTVMWKWVVPNIYSGIRILLYGRAGAKSKSGRVNRSAQKHLCRLVASLTDFHKSQCFFMLATNIAALVVVRRGGLDPQSLQQMYNTWIFLKVVAINGFLPITFTLTNLYIVGILSWYMIVISVLTVALSIGTFVAVGQFNPSASEMQNLHDIANSSGPQECSYKNPGVYCYSPIDSPYGLYYGSSSIDSHASSILSFCVVVLFLLVGHRSDLKGYSCIRRIRRAASTALLRCVFNLWAFLQYAGQHRKMFFLVSKLQFAARTCTMLVLQIWTRLSKTTRYARLEERATLGMIAIRARIAECNNSRFAQLFAQRPSNGIFQTYTAVLIFKIVVAISFLYLYIKFFIMFLSDLAWFASNDVYNKTWNFGQVVAITVWAPPICEYIHLEIRESAVPTRSMNERICR